MGQLANPGKHEGRGMSARRSGLFNTSWPLISEDAITIEFNVGPSHTLVLYSPAHGSTNVPVIVGFIAVSNYGRGSYRVTLSPTSGTRLSQTDIIQSNPSGAQLQLGIPQMARPVLRLAHLPRSSHCAQ